MALRLSFAFLVLAAPSALAQDVVLNGHFHTNISGWAHAGGGTQAWSALDWQALPASGSARVTNDFVSGNVTTGSSQCALVAATGTYEVGAEIRIPSGQAPTGLAFVAVSWFTNPTCTNPATAGTNAQLVPTTTTDSWVPTLNSAVSIPAGTQSVRVSMSVLKTTAGGSLAAHFDRVRFGPAGTTPVELQDLRVE